MRTRCVTPSVDGSRAVARSAARMRSSASGIRRLLVVTKCVRERLARTEELRLHRALADPEPLGDGSHVEPEVVAQRGDFALTTGQRAQRLPNRVGVGAGAWCVGEIALEWD